MPDSHVLEISAFKHVVVPIGVVVGLGVARMMTTLADYFQHRSRVRFSLGHGLWGVVLFLFFVGLWWIAWGLRSVDVDLWTFFTLIFLLAGPCLVFLAAALLMPAMPSAGTLDLGENLEQAGRAFFLALMCFLLWLMATELWLQEEPLITLPKRALQMVAIGFFGIGLVRPTRRMTTILGAIALLMVTFALATVRAKLG